MAVFDEVWTQIDGKPQVKKERMEERGKRPKRGGKQREGIAWPHTFWRNASVVINQLDL